MIEEIEKAAREGKSLGEALGLFWGIWIINKENLSVYPEEYKDDPFIYISNPRDDWNPTWNLIRDLEETIKECYGYERVHLFFGMYDKMREVISYILDYGDNVGLFARSLTSDLVYYTEHDWLGDYEYVEQEKELLEEIVNGLTELEEIKWVIRHADIWVGRDIARDIRLLKYESYEDLARQLLRKWTEPKEV